MYSFNFITHVNRMGSHIGRTLLYLVCVMNWPDDGFNKAETCCHVTN